MAATATMYGCNSRAKCYILYRLYIWMQLPLYMDTTASIYSNCIYIWLQLPLYMAATDFIYGCNCRVRCYIHWQTRLCNCLYIWQLPLYMAATATIYGCNCRVTCYIHWQTRLCNCFYVWQLPLYMAATILTHGCNRGQRAIYSIYGCNCLYIWLQLLGNVLYTVTDEIV